MIEATSGVVIFRARFFFFTKIIRIDLGFAKGNCWLARHLM